MPTPSSLRISPILFTLSIMAFFASAFADEPANGVQMSVLHLSNGDHVSGTLVDSLAEDSLGWQSPAFTSPFHFALGGVASIHFAAPAKLPQPEGDYCFEIAGGDMLFGSLVGLDATTAVLDVPGIGRLNIDRTFIQRMYRWGGGTDQLFVGPTGLYGWQTSGEDHVWREDAGQLIADRAGAILRRDFGIPNQARFEFELSWLTPPNFEFALGVGDDAKTSLRAYRFEVWGDEIIVQRETEREADVVSLQKVAATSGRLHLQAFLDQQLGRLLVFSSAGTPLADLTVQTDKPQVFGGLQLTNRGGDLRLERLRIGRWNGEPPRNVELDKSRIHASDGTITYGLLTSFDAKSGEFVIGDEANPQRIAEDQVHDVFLSQPPSKVAPRGLRAVYLSGMKISGDLVRVEDRQVILKCPGIAESIVVPLEALQTLVVLKPQSDPPELPQRRGRFETSGTRLHGCLVDGSEGETRCLVWQPARSSTSSPLLHGISARIVYHEPPPPPPPNLQQQQLQARVRVQRAPGLVGQIQGIFSDGEPRNPSRKNSQAPKSVLHLRTGDTIPCAVTGIDERGVTFESTVSDATFVPHDQIKALELISDAAPMQFGNPKKERMLTVPRMQRDNPPTHLVRSIDGDYLRGRLLSMDDTQLQIELRLEAKIIRRDRVARIIWLHPETLDPSAKLGGSEESKDANRVQALPSDGNRLTFVPEQLAGSVLAGRSELLGTCRVDLQHVDQLLIGSTIEQAAAGLAFHQWKLKPSADPLAPKEPGGGSGDGGEGKESPLVGKPAPDISLDMLDGNKFLLSDHKQKVVILDFWASWCGPCLQVMPQIDKVTHEFADQGVELFAINLEETSDKVKAALERLKLSTAVVLDRDGRVAERYGATSIPQTVIIDREGNVARLFVGGGPRFDEQLREALKRVLSGENQKSE